MTVFVVRRMAGGDVDEIVAVCRREERALQHVDSYAHLQPQDPEFPPDEAAHTECIAYRLDVVGGVEAVWVEVHTLDS